MMANKRYRNNECTNSLDVLNDDDGFDSLSDGGRPWKIPTAGQFVRECVRVKEKMRFSVCERDC